jgi:cytochrome P450
MTDTKMGEDPSPLDTDPERRHEAWKALRKNGPVLPLPDADGVVAAISYRAVETGLRSFEDFGGSAGADGLDEADKTVAAMTEPRHGKVRRIINSVVAFHKSQQIEPYLRQLTESLLDKMLAEARLAGSVGVDVVAHLAKPIPPAAMARLMGFPEVDSQMFQEWARGGSARMQEAATKGLPLGIADVNPELRDYVDARIQERLAVSQEDWPQDALSRFLLTEVDGERLDHRTVRTQIMFMIGAGSETTRNTIGNLFYRLGRDPDAFAALRQDPALMEVAIEETLRIDPPAQFMVRTCRRPAELEGTQVEPGQRVFMCIGAGNRDETVFEDPSSFRLDRPRYDHLAFGSGSHVCPGATLARLELRTALRAFAERVIAFHLKDPDHYEALPTAMLQGPRKLMIVIDEEADR